MKRTLIALLSVFSFTVATNCYGGFIATKKLHHWNGGLGNKWIQTIAFWALIIIPVYEIAVLIDFVVLNLLEFWTGSNPMAMTEGQIETQIVKHQGKEFEITATKNQFAIREIKNGSKGEPVLLVYEPQESAWYAKSRGKSMKISESSELDMSQVKLFHPDGRVVEVKL